MKILSVIPWHLREQLDISPVFRPAAGEITVPAFSTPGR